MSKPVVLHILSSSSYSGAEHVAINIINLMSDQFVSIYSSPDGDIRYILEKYNINFFPLKSMSFFNVRNAIKNIKPDIIHAHDFRASIIAALASPKSKIISHLHSNPLWIQRINLYTILYTAMSIFFSKIIVVSKSIINEFKLRNCFRKKTIVVYNIVDYEKIKKMSENKNVEGADLIFVGRFTKEKDPLRFIHIVKKIKKKNKNITALMLGKGELVDECNQLIERLDLRTNIKILGFVENPYAYMRNSKILVIPSRWEGYGLVALEAMALGLPVLATKVGGLQEVIIDKETGFFCDTDEDFVTRINEILNSPDLYTELSLKSYCRAKKISDVYQFKSTFANIYKMVLEEE